MAGPDVGGLVLVLNSGSSTLKFAVVDAASGDRPLDGIVDRLTSVGERRAAVADVLDRHRGTDLIGVGHRVVHGGDRFSSSVLIDDAVIDAIRSVSDLAPLHNPANLLGIEAVAAQRPELPQVAVFDTAFHQTMPAAAYRYAVPEPWYADHGIRRYGFHGTSHRYVSEEAAARLGRPITELRMVTAHLGNGCSAAAVRDGVSVDTTMGLTPLEGLVMGTRSGDVDPGLFARLAGRTGLDVDAITSALNQESGLLALSGVGNDMRAIAAAAAGGHGRAALAIDVFAYRAAKAIAALVVPLGRLDALVFTGGIGENDAAIRRSILDRLGFLGLAEDRQANEAHGRSTGGRITVDGAPVAPVALVVPTDEELLIARDTARLVRSPRPE
ncbi:MAG: acetate kinase [Acidimicrobiales bacterium]